MCIRDRAYSAVNQPRPVSRKNGGTPSCTEAVHNTRVRPAQTSALPAAISVKPGYIASSLSSDVYKRQAVVERSRVPAGMQISPVGLEELFVYMARGDR